MFIYILVENILVRYKLGLMRLFFNLLRGR